LPVQLEEPVSEQSCILGVRLDAVTMTEAVDRLDGFVRSGVPHQIVTINIDFIRLAVRDTAFMAVLNGADLAVADGVPVLWAARLLGFHLPERVTGVDLVERVAALSAACGYSLYLLGAAPGVAAAAAAALCGRYPGLRIAGTCSPPYGEHSAREEAEMVARIRGARPDLLLVAFGAPRQDYWIARHKAALAVPVCIGVGGTFDLLAGKLKRAPRWLQRCGLEWAYRLAQEPGRLWKRYLLGDLPFYLRIVGSRVRMRQG
jgi:N-acetylglucosaminyldiphosphoundecaprenol N-acetyl-beta-D-mannosaminyltransferase